MTSLDITDRKVAEDALREATESLRFIIEGTKTGLWDWDLKTNQVHYSHEWKQLLGYENHEIADQLDEWQRLTHPADVEPTLARVNAFLQQPVGTLEAEFRMQHKNGEYLWILSRATARLGDDGRPVRLLGLHINITERKHAEETSRERERQLSTLISNLPGFVYRCLNDKDYTTKFVSEGIADLTGYPAEDFLRHRREFGKMIHPGDQERVWMEIQTALQQNRHYELTYRILTANSEEKWVWERGQGVSDSTGQLQALEGFVTDITHLRRAEEEIRIVNKELQTLNRIIIARSKTLDTKEILNLIMDEALQITGLEGGTICLVGPDDTLHPAIQRGASEATIRDLTTNAIKVGDCLCGTCARDLSPLILRDRESVLRFATRESTRGEGFLFHAAFPLIAAGKCTGVLCVFTRTDHKPEETKLKLQETITSQVALSIETARLYEDISQYSARLSLKVKERTAELEQANLKLLEIDRLKSMFIASMSHELRTPLNSVIGFSSILLKQWKGPLNAEQELMLSNILRSGNHLLSLINDVIDVSKIESGKIEAYIQEFDLQDVISEAVESVKKVVYEKGLELRIEVPHLTLKTDRRRLLQCVLNLVSNAVKFTEHGVISVHAGIVDKHLVEISIADSGIGLRKEDIPKLFNAFSRIDSHLRSTVPGTGLGLYLTRKLATEVLKGTVTAESTYGKESRFTLKIPLNLETS